MIYCSDSDLLHWEPGIFREASFASQTLLSGAGSLSGTSFTISAGSFASANVAAKQVMVLEGAPSGSFPIVSVDGATQVTLSVLYDALFPPAGAPQASPIGDGPDLLFAVRTFSPQAQVVSAVLEQAGGVSPGGGQAIRNAESLRRPCVLGTLQMIYSALAAASGEAAHVVRADLYERLYRRALRSVRLHIDTDGDGEPDLVRPLNVLQLVRT